MKKLVLIFLFVTVAVPAWSLSYIVDGPIYDADKSGGDSQMCWAASISNVITYSGWSMDMDADDVFSIYKNNLTNAFGWFEPGLSYWLDWYYPETDYGSVATMSYFNMRDTVSDMHGWLLNGGGVYLAINGTNSSHALTVYGVEYDNSGYTGLWVVDSSDMVDNLIYIPIIQEYWGTYQKNVWFIDGGRYNGYYLANAGSLIKNSAPAPEPGTLFLFSCGLLPYYASRKRNSSDA